MNDVKILNKAVFACPLIVANFGQANEDLNLNLCKDIKTEMLTEAYVERSGVNAWQSQSGMETKYDSFSLLRDQLEKVLFSQLKNFGFADEDVMRENSIISDLWANVIENSAGFHMPHTHSGGKNFFTGAYYPANIWGQKTVTDFEKLPNLKYGGADDGDLILFDEMKTLKTINIPESKELINKHGFYGADICVTPKESVLVAFPCYKQHMVIPRKDPRVSISFSLHWK
ncbi:MAG: hypothetical protein COA52_01125 [Hyphomicrobiales bacterium]|nr:MAG: hypothetical protein COA52_00035 [Hyphomicrobiales bacterium]PCJ96842.1 MAG: hypothetical protein COA52_01125 [Hyphomicrobiales bacterium]